MSDADHATGGDAAAGLGTLPLQTVVDSAGQRPAPGSPAARDRAIGGLHLPRRLPIGAECLPDGRVHFRVWAPRRTQVSVVLGTEGDRRAVPLRGGGQRVLLGAPSEAADGTLYQLPPGRRRALSGSRFALSARWSVRPVARRRPFGVCVDGRTMAQARRSAARSSTRCTWATFTPEGTLGGGGARARGARRSRRHVRRADAGRRVRRAASAGAMTASTSSRPRISTASPTTCAASWTRRTATGSPSSWTSSTTTSGRTATTSTSSPMSTSPTGTRRTGARPSTSTGPASGPVREFFLANARAWIEEFHFDGLRLDATQSIFDDSSEHILAALGARGAGRGTGARDLDRRRERAAGHAARPAGRARRLRARRALERRLSPRGDGRAHRQERGLLHRLQRLAAGADLGRQVGLSLPGAALQVAADAPRHARPRSAARDASSPSSRTTTRSPTRPTAGALHLLDEPRPLPRDDGLAAPRPAHAHALPGTGVRLLGPVPVLRRSRRRARRQGRARAAPRSSRSSASIATPEMVAALPDPTARRDVRALQARFRRARTPSRASTLMHRDLLRLRRADPVFSAQRRARRGRRRARAGGLRAALLRRGRRRTACSSSTSARSRLESRARAPARAARGHALAHPLVERRRALWRGGHAAARDAAQLAHPRPCGGRPRAAAGRRRRTIPRAGAERGDGGSGGCAGTALRRSGGHRSGGCPFGCSSCAGEEARDAERCSAASGW